MKETPVPHLKLVADNSRETKLNATKSAGEILQLLNRFYDAADLIKLKHRCDQISATSPNNTYIGFAENNKVHFDFLFESLDNPETLENDLRLVNVLMMLTYERLMTGRKRLAVGESTDNSEITGRPDFDRLDAWINRLMTAICFSAMSVRKAGAATPFSLKEAVNDSVHSVLKRS
jgi:hypothetical protein